MGSGDGHAVVLGAGMSGLLAARTLADFYERVTVVERDVLPAAADHRRGLPQGRHFHTLLRRGAEILETLFPGLTDELATAGAPTASGLETRIILSGHELSPVDTGATGIQATRPLLEAAVRARVADIPHVKIVDGTAAAGVRADAGRVIGVRIAPAAGGREELLDADLVVDAMGRAAHTPRWLAELGYPVPAEDRITVDLRYVSRELRLAPRTPPPNKLTLVGPVPGRTRAFAMAEQEGDRWMLTAVGMAGDHPSDTDEVALLGFVKTMAPPDLYAAIRDASPLSEPRAHKFPASMRRRYERLRRFPPGLLVFGDAICSFNPIYGQGMTVAALEAEILGRCLHDGKPDLARRFFRAAAKAINPAWQLSAGGDLALPEIEGHRPLATRLINHYIARSHRVAVQDTTVSAAFRRIGLLLDPPSAVLAPRILLRVLFGGRRR